MRSFGEVVRELYSSHVPYDWLHIFFHAKIGVTVAIVATGNALSVVPWVTDEEGHTLLTLGSEGVVVTVQTSIQLIGPSTVGVAVALALNATVGSNVSKVTFAFVRFGAKSPDTTLPAHGYTNASIRFVSVGTLTLVAM